MSAKSVESVKCILIGESGVGKSSLVVSYTRDDYPVKYEPTAFDTYIVDLRVENFQVNLQICDAGGAPGIRSLRELAYPSVHVVILCFSVVQPETLWALRDRWLPELAASGLVLNPSAFETASRIGCLPPSNHQSATGGSRPPGPAFILVGCACDLRNDIKRLLDLSDRDELPVNDTVAHRLAVELGAEAYIECSALTQKQLKKVFDLAVWYGLQAQQAMQCVTADSNNSGPPTRNSFSPLTPLSGSSRKSKRHRQRSVMKANNEAAQHSNNLCATQRPLWKKLLCLR